VFLVVANRALQDDEGANGWQRYRVRRINVGSRERSACIGKPHTPSAAAARANAHDAACNGDMCSPSAHMAQHRNP
jgi:hypothetical protein